MRVFRRHSWKTWLVLLAVFALVAAACGGDDDDAGTTAAPGGDTTTAPDERPYEGVTLKFAKAPHGEDEIENFETWLAPFEEQTGITIEHTVVPWNDLEAIYSANFAGNDVFDVTYQVSTHLTLFGEQGAFVDMTPLLEGEDYAMEAAHYPGSIVDASVYKDKLYGLPFIIGTIVMFVNLDLLEAAGITEIPTTTEELITAAQAVQNPPDVWGFYTPTTVVDFGWYFNLQNIHNFGGDIISDDFESATLDSEPVKQATQYAVDLICDAQVQPPLGQFDREGAIELFKAGKLAFLLDEPLRVSVFQDEGLDFEWDIAQPVGAPGGRQTQFSTTGHWVIAEKSENKEAAWELVKFLSSADFSQTYNERYGFVPARDDVDVSGGNPLLAKNFEWAMTTWDGLVTHPKIAQLLDEYVKALEAATTCQTSVDDALAEAQARASDLLGS
jgi:ABC-type glycerol-3-phosphate transport system substrate-binding protein